MWGRGWNPKRQGGSLTWEPQGFSGWVVGEAYEFSYIRGHLPSGFWVRAFSGEECGVKPFNSISLQNWPPDKLFLKVQSDKSRKMGFQKQTYVHIDV